MLGAGLGGGVGVGATVSQEAPSSSGSPWSPITLLC